MILLIPLYAILYKIYIPRINAFGCFDDCNNFMRGYFVLNGKELFSEVFSGHQPFGSYLSTFIQWLTKPQNIFELVLRHRQFLLLFSFFLNALLITRFGARVIIFTIIFEFSKFYLFGDRFLGDGMIVYALIYLTGLVIVKLKNQKIYKIDYLLAAFLTWFIIFMRGPYVPVAMLTYLLLIWSWPIKKRSIASFAIFVFLSTATVFLHNINEYFFDVITFNFQAVLPAESKSIMFGPSIVQWFFYPLYIFFYGNLNIFKTLLIGINVVYLILFANLLRNKKYLLAGFIFLALGLTNIRTVMPGSMFYNSFHMLVWYGLFIFITVNLLFQDKIRKIYFISGLLILVTSFLYLISSPLYFAHEKVDGHKEFITNYGYLLQEGEVIKILSNPNDTLFLDGSDDLIYWQSKRFSPYKYSWYTSSMPYFKKFSDERIKMFKTTPPDFYREFGSCPKKSVQANQTLPEFVKNKYVRLYTGLNESCIFVRVDKLNSITNDQWERAREFQYNQKPEEL